MDHLPILTYRLFTLDGPVYWDHVGVQIIHSNCQIRPNTIHESPTNSSPMQCPPSPSENALLENKKLHTKDSKVRNQVCCSTAFLIHVNCSVSIQMLRRWCLCCYCHYCWTWSCPLVCSLYRCWITWPVPPKALTCARSGRR